MAATNESGSAKHENRIDALGTAPNESGGAKHENWIRRPWYRPKWVRERKTWKRDSSHSVPTKTSQGMQNMQTRHDTLGTVKK
jgi:hypothetical protein